MESKTNDELLLPGDKLKVRGMPKALVLFCKINACYPEVGILVQSVILKRAQPLD